MLDKVALFSRFGLALSSREAKRLGGFVYVICPIAGTECPSQWVCFSLFDVARRRVGSFLSWHPLRGSLSNII